MRKDFHEEYRQARRGGVSEWLAMVRRLRMHMQKGLERLEAPSQKQAPQAYREAFIVSGSFDGERHLVVDGDPAAARCYFLEMPGPGPQLTDFGRFEVVLHL